MNILGALRGWAWPSLREAPRRLGDALGRPQAITAEAGVTVRLADGAVLFDKRADEKFPVASVTKLLTAIVVEETVADLSAPIRARDIDIINPSLAFCIQSGESSTFGDQLEGMLIKSDNNAAQLLARATMQAVEPGLDDRTAVRRFLERMTARAAELGVVVGTELQWAYTSAVLSPRDVSVLLAHIHGRCPRTLAAMGRASRTITVRSADGTPRAYAVTNTTRAADRKMLPGFIGAKTGTENWKGAAALLWTASPVPPETGADAGVCATVMLLSSPHSARYRDARRAIRASTPLRP